MIHYCIISHVNWTKKISISNLCRFNHLIFNVLFLILGFLRILAQFLIVNKTNEREKEARKW